MDTHLATMTADKYVTIDGLKIRYIEEGSGYPVLFLHGASLGSSADVFRQEPLPKEHPFWRHPRITVIPHASRGQFPAEITPLICNHIRRFQRGEPMTDRVDVAAGY